MAAIRGFTGWVGTVLGTPDPVGLGQFYAALVGGESDAGDAGFVTLHLGGTHYLACQLETDHRPPVWPSGDGEQQMQVHLDIGVTSLPPAVADAEALGARLADFQPQEDVRVLLDPAGHPFCLYLDNA
jgi:hypothetical protein